MALYGRTDRRTYEAATICDPFKHKNDRTNSLRAPEYFLDCALQELVSKLTTL